MARFLAYPALVALAAWGALVLLMLRGELPAWATWTLVHGAPAAAYLVWALGASIVCAVRRWRPRYSLRTLAIFLLLATCAEALLLHWEPWYCERVLSKELGAVNCIAYSPDGLRIVTGGDDGTARLWDAASGKQVFEMPNGGWVWRCTFSAGGELLATAACKWSKASVWNTKTGKRVREVDAKSDPVHRAEFSPDAGCLVTAAFGLAVWSIETGKLVYEIAPPQGEWFMRASFSPDGKRILSATGKTVQLRKADDGSVVFDLEHNDDVHEALFSPDGVQIAGVCDDGTVIVWDASSGNKLLSLAGRKLDIDRVCPLYLDRIVFSSGGGRLVAGGEYGGTLVWDLMSGRCLAQRKEHLLAFDSAGRRVATAETYFSRWYSEPQVLDILHIIEADSGMTLAVLKSGLESVTCASFSPDGRSLAVAGLFGTVKVYHRHRPEQWWGIFYMREFWFSAVFAAALVWSLFTDKACFARMDAEAARAKENRSRAGP
jgi:WD40 repeat protein